MTKRPQQSHESNRPEQSINQQITNAQRGISSGDDLIDALASLQPGADTTFQQRLEAELMQKASKASANGTGHIPEKPMTLTRGELAMYPQKHKNRATSRVSWIAGIAAALLLVFIGGMWIGSGANVPSFLAPVADNTPAPSQPVVVTATPMLLPPTVVPPTVPPTPSATFTATATFVPTVTAPAVPPTSLIFTPTPIPYIPSASTEVSGFIAQVDIQPGTVIDLPMLQQQAFPSDMVPDDAALTAEDLIGRTAAVTIFQGQIIIERMLEPLE